LDRKRNDQSLIGQIIQMQLVNSFSVRDLGATSSTQDLSSNPAGIKRKASLMHGYYYFADTHKKKEAVS